MFAIVNSAVMNIEGHIYFPINVLFSLGIYLGVKLPVLGLPPWFSSEESACNTGATGSAGPALGQEAPLEKEMASSILTWRIPWAWWTVVHRVTKSRTQLQ